MVGGIAVAILSRLVSGELPPKPILVEFDPDSIWYPTAISIIATTLRSGFLADYHAFSNDPDDVRSNLKRLGLDPVRLEEDEQLAIIDWYSPGIGRKSNEKIWPVRSLLISDIAIGVAQAREWRGKYQGEPKSEWHQTDTIHLDDNWSVVFRHNDEKSVIQYMLTKVMVPELPLYKRGNPIHLIGIAKGVHSEYVYRTLEDAAYGVVDIKTQEAEGKIENLLRVRVMKGQQYESRWCRLKVDENFEVTI